MRECLTPYYLALTWKWTGKRLLGAFGWYGTSAAFRFGSLYESLLVLRKRDGEGSAARTQSGVRSV